VGTACAWDILLRVDEAHLAEQLISVDTSDHPGLDHATDFVAGWLDGRGVPVREVQMEGRRCLVATVGDGPVHVIFNGHLDVVPGHAEQFRPRRSEGRLYGRGAYDMKAALASMMHAAGDLAREGLEGARVELVVVPDEERAEPGANCSEMLVRDGLRGDFVICGEPTDLHVGIQAKGVLLLRLRVPGVAAHGSTPALGRNAVLRALELYEAVGRLPFMGEHSAMFDSPSVNLGRIAGGDALNKVPDHCSMWIDVRTLPGQSTGEVLTQIQHLDPEIEVEVLLNRSPADVSPRHPMVVALLEAARVHHAGAAAVGRNGSSDAIPFLEVGIPAVEFGPVGAGHHGPDEYVEIASLTTYRHALADFVRAVAGGVVPQAATA
jgi:succinyl-diaminopimelate desuccinylase